MQSQGREWTPLGLAKGAARKSPLQEWRPKFMAFVLQWVSPEDDGYALLLLRTVCKHWRNVLDDHLIPQRLLRLRHHDVDALKCIHLRWPHWRLHVVCRPKTALAQLSGLNGLHHLDLNGCSWVRDVSGLDRVHTLDLSWCAELQDVSGLGGVYSLNLSGCPKLRDVSGLGRVHSLDLSWCEGVQDVGGLGGVHSLNLSGCAGLRDVSALGGVHSLDLSWCIGVSDFSGLGGVHSLNLSGCPKLKDVSDLAGVQHLDLSWCQLEDVSSLAGVPSLVQTLDFCLNLHGEEKGEGEEDGAGGSASRKWTL